MLRRQRASSRGRMIFYGRLTYGTETWRGALGGGALRLQLGATIAADSRSLAEHLHPSARRSSRYRRAEGGWG